MQSPTQSLVHRDKNELTHVCLFSVCFYGMLWFYFSRKSSCHQCSPESFPLLNLNKYSASEWQILFKCKWKQKSLPVFLSFKHCFIKLCSSTQFPNIIKLYSNLCGGLLSVLPFGNDFLSSSVTHRYFPELIWRCNSVWHFQYFCFTMKKLIFSFYELSIFILK